MHLRRFVVGLLVLVGLLVAGWLTYRPDRALRSATTAVAQMVCAKTFVSGLDPQTTFAETMERPGLRRLRAVMRYRVERDTRIVDASLLGLHVSRASYHDGLGCVLLQGQKPPYLPHSNVGALRAAAPAPDLPDIAAADPVEPADAGLRAALDHAFEEPASPPLRRTKAVVVIKDGRLIAERYAATIGVDTPLIGFSMTKTVTNALLGILTRQGRLSPQMPAPVAEWRDAADGRHDITLEQLMRMTSGLALDETNSGFDPSSQMEIHRDMAAFAVHAPLIAPPGQRWAYSSASTQILARIIRDAAGGPEQTIELAWRELFGPLGMRSATLQYDGTGTMQGYANMLASARDWAKLGLLYLGDGVVGDRRILPEGWVAMSAKATLDTDYGAGLWTNRSQHAHALGRAKQGIPADAFFAFGLLGQRLVIMPSQRMVVVRLGDSVDPDGDIRGVARLVREVIAATESPATAVK
ncbi:MULTISPECIES: serine hydrolase domain-containing protein [Bradyrhizobium]|uniref:Serine hydrolase n=3 Tax=Bradyrhizobium TaxID=374 RepID=A0ABS5G0R7_9BRAD|nr:MULTISPECIES: serine hydrolase [Bradyrhizobium]MBR1134873.1 serine hydrolase [Bradyrhizobium denitrificans]MDU1492321.1 serine hydrolase [Bradyrhizobium sp.]MDU1542186.1 serine hydrolase [Bradyrhizobium sp.]MDU1666163.1 serine hydrolase [Bradyrhizobium sp.]MDU1690670.1 serine hydrolase [Bradyrhizobium sp.]